MKTLWESFILFLESIGRARAASELARVGRYEEARKIYEDDTEVHP